MLSRVKIEHLISELYREAAAQTVVHIRKSAVSIESGISGLCIDDGNDLVSHRGGLIPFSIEIMGSTFFRDLAHHVIRPALTFAVAVNLEESHRLSRVYFLLLEEESAGDIVAQILSSVLKAAVGKSNRVHKRKVVIEHRLWVGVDIKHFAVFREGESEVSSRNLLYINGIHDTCPYPVERKLCLEVLHLHPRSNSLSQLLLVRHRNAVWIKSRHTVKNRQLNGLVLLIGDARNPDKPADRLGRHRHIKNLGKDTVFLIFYRESVESYIHPGAGAVIAKSFTYSPVTLDKCPEAVCADKLICGMRGIELHDGVVLVLRAKGGNSLSAVAVEGPDRNTLVSRQSREKTCKYRFPAIIIDDKSSVFVEHIAPPVYTFMLEVQRGLYYKISVNFVRLLTNPSYP